MQDIQAGAYTRGHDCAYVCIYAWASSVIVPVCAYMRAGMIAPWEHAGLRECKTYSAHAQLIPFTCRHDRAYVCACKSRNDSAHV
jgi:hypothetical protein